MKKIILPIFVGLLVLGIGCQKNNAQPVSTTDRSATTTIEVNRVYTSEAYGLRFEYPNNWRVYEDASQLDVQPPEPAQWSNYFTVAILKNVVLEDFVKKFRVKEVLSIDGETSYLVEDNPSASGTLLYLMISHDNKVYQIHFFKTWYETMPEIRQMIQSIRFI